MTTKIYIYDMLDDTLFKPITETRSVFELRCGAFTYIERLLSYDTDDLISGVIVRPELKALATENYSELDINAVSKCGRIVFMNGLAGIKKEHFETIITAAPQTVIHSGEEVIAMILDFDKISDGDFREFILEDLIQLEFDNHIEIDVKMPAGIWDLPLINSDQIEQDFDFILNNDSTVKTLNESSFGSYEVRVIKPERIILRDNILIEPYVLLDASDGPIIIDDDVTISTGSQLRGPLHISKDCKIVTARISGGCSFGPVSRMGGEIEQSIVQGYSNKYHDGFLGHSYLGKWVNLGALSTNSDLKNNYGRIKYGIGVEEVFQTDSIKVGAFLGDHAKTGIGTLINSGSNIGTGVNLYGGELAPKYLKPMSWGSAKDGFVQYDIDRMIQTAKTVASRRGLELSEVEVALLKQIHSKYWQ